MNGHVTAGDLAARYGGSIDGADVTEFVDGLNALAKVGVGRVFGPGEPDPLSQEHYAAALFFRQVGRPPTAGELRGRPDPGCAACARECGTCDDHARKLGEPITYPPRPWPSESPEHYPGTYLFTRPGRKDAYDVRDSVG